VYSRNDPVPFMLGDYHFAVDGAGAAPALQSPG